MRALALLLWAAAAPAQAVMFRCPPAEDGAAPVVTNLLSEEEARQRACERVGVRSSPLDAAVDPPKAASRPAAPRTDANGHRVDTGTQKVRDDQRRVILEAELRSEEEALGRAQVQAGTDAGMARVAARHTANVEALRRELGRLR